MMNNNEISNRNRILVRPQMCLGSATFKIICAFTIVVSVASMSQADQFIGHKNGREVVVHSNPIPVFLHRLVPPNYGRHVTAREYQTGRLTSQPLATPNTTPQRDLNRK